MKRFMILLTMLLLMVLSSPMVYSKTSKPFGGDAGNATQSSKKRAVEGSLTEEFSFWIKDFKFDHQGLNNNLNISVSFRYVPGIANSDYPDFRLLAKEVETLLTNYPNEEDYWEIVNKKLTAQLMNKFAALASITIEIKIDASSSIPYVRSSRVTRERSNRKRS